MRLAAIFLGCIITALDFLTKWWVRSSDGLHNYTVIDGFFRIRYVQNEGIAFGLFHALQSQWKPIILAVLAIVALIVVLYYIWSTPLHQTWTLLCLGLLLGGILGNFIDRLIHQYVTDFIEVHWRELVSWPTFNVADSAITCGVLFILYQTFFRAGDRELQKTESVTTDEQV
ncbi:signal peptidase II [Acidobacteria bacterium AH-259-D05]|nr:signal peptidase II [Acidobacteria bacterium AH-259-D05]